MSQCLQRGNLYCRYSIVSFLVSTLCSIVAMGRERFLTYLSYFVMVIQIKALGIGSVNSWLGMEWFGWRWGSAISANIFQCNNVDGDLRRKYGIKISRSDFVL